MDKGDAVVFVQPPGRRSCRKSDGMPGDGGYWTHCVGKTPDAHFMADLDLELSAAYMGDSDLRLFKRELHSRMVKASEGLLRYGPDAKTDDVYELERSRQNLLELRYEDVTSIDATGGMVRRLSRLYFTERESHDDELLAVAFFTKAPGPLGLAEQNKHIDSALGRLYSHEIRGR